MPMQTNMNVGIRPVDRPQAPSTTEGVSRRGDGGSSSGFSPRTNVAIQNAVDDMAGILSKISSHQDETMEKMPEDLQKVVQNVLKQAFSMNETLSQGIGSTLESQRFSMEQLTALSRMLHQLGNLVEKGFSTDFGDDLGALLKNFKSFVTQTEGSVLEPVLLNKASFELLDTKALEDLPKALQALVAAMQVVGATSAQNQGGEGSSLAFLKQLVQYFMPKPASDGGQSPKSTEGNPEANKGNQNSETQGYSRANTQTSENAKGTFQESQNKTTLTKDMAPEQARTSGQDAVNTSNAKDAGKEAQNLQNREANTKGETNQTNQNGKQTANSENMPKDARNANNLNNSNNNPNANANAKGNANANANTNNANSNSGANNNASANSNANANANTNVNSNNANPNANSNNANANTNANANNANANNSAGANANASANNNAGGNAAANSGNTSGGQNSGTNDAQNLGQKDAANPNSFKNENAAAQGKDSYVPNLRENLQSKYLRPNQNGTPTPPTEAQQARVQLSRVPLQNTPQAMETMKAMAELLLKNAKMTEADTKLLQNFVNGRESVLSEREARQLQTLLRLCQQNVPTTVQQAAVQQNLPDLPRLWAFMQLCDLAVARRMTGRQLKKAGKNVADLVLSMRHSMSGSNNQVQGQRSLNFMMPLYLMENEKSYPSYIHVYDENAEDPYTGEFKKETWLRICVLTDNIGAVELTCRVYDENALDMRLFFSSHETAEEFRDIIPEFRSSVGNVKELMLNELKIGAVDERRFL
ncbi:MAG: hypothetical protein IKN12_08635 [Selenomonadaceae bacterium]|nr:hypothetical protein [Selenomonadaceae bacterium]